MLLKSIQSGSLKANCDKNMRPGVFFYLNSFAYFANINHLLCSFIIQSSLKIQGSPIQWSNLHINWTNMSSLFTNLENIELNIWFDQIGYLQQDKIRNFIFL